MAGGGAALGKNAGHQLAVEVDGLRRQDFRRRQDDRLRHVQERPALLLGQLRQDAGADVAQVGDPFLNIRIGNMIEEGLVFLNGLLDGGGRVDALVHDGGADFADEGGVAQQQLMGAEDGRLVLADLLRDAADDGVEFTAGRGAGGVEARDLRGEGLGGEVDGFASSQRLVEAIRPGHGHARRYGNAFDHDAIALSVQCSVFGVQQTPAQSPVLLNTEHRTPNTILPDSPIARCP